MGAGRPAELGSVGVGLPCKPVDCIPLPFDTSIHFCCFLFKMPNGLKAQYSGPPLIRTPLLPNNSVLIRGVSFGEREHYVHS